MSIFQPIFFYVRSTRTHRHTHTPHIFCEFLQISLHPCVPRSACKRIMHRSCDGDSPCSTTHSKARSCLCCNTCHCRALVGRVQQTTYTKKSVHECMQFQNQSATFKSAHAGRGLKFKQCQLKQEARPFYTKCALSVA